MCIRSDVSRSTEIRSSVTVGGLGRKVTRDIGETASAASDLDPGLKDGEMGEDGGEEFEGIDMSVEEVLEDSDELGSK